MRYTLQQTGIVLVALALMAIHGPKVFAATVTTVTTQPTFDLYQGTSKVTNPTVTRPTFAECMAAGAAINKGDGCQSRNGKFKRTTVADPVNCVASAPVETAGAWSACSAGTRTRTITSTRTVVTPPANGGLACPVLVTTRTESESCAVAPPPPAAEWVRAAGEDAAFMLYAPAKVRYGAGSTWVTRDLPGGRVDCNNATFGDPLFNTLKWCEVSPASALTAPPAPPPTPAVGTASLTWTAPTQNTDGSPLTNLAGYRVYRGTSANALNEVIQIPGAANTAYAYTQLANGTHYFAVSAYSAAGAESAKSEVGSKIIP